MVYFFLCKDNYNINILKKQKRRMGNKKMTMNIVQHPDPHPHPDECFTIYLIMPSKLHGTAAFGA
jgi:hypothetical protein